MNTIRAWICATMLLIPSVAIAADRPATATSAETSAEVSPQWIAAWTNQRGSTLYIDAVAPNGQISGQYVNRASGSGCQNTPYPVIGWLYGTAITFTVKWQNSSQSCNSITSWAGFFANGRINTQWELVVNGSTQIQRGSDVFTPVAPVEHKSLMLESP